MGAALLRPTTIGELASRLGGVADQAARGRSVSRLVVPGEAGSDAGLVVLASRRQLRTVVACGGLVLCAEEFASTVPEGRRWTHSHVMWVVAKLLGEVAAHEQEAAPPCGQPPALVAAGAIIESGAAIMAGARIGPACVIQRGAVIHGRVQLGARVLVGPQAVIGRPGFGWTEGPGSERIRVPQLGGVVVEDDVEIGALCSVDAGTLAPTRLGAGVKLDAQVHVGHNAQIGGGTLVAGQAGIAGSAVVGEQVLIGGQAGITDHAQVAAGTRVAAKSGVIGDIPERAVVAGFPAVKRMRWLRAMARLLRTPPRPPHG
jgi:UDP-3-O-[3-hydroxymyristoyl] glucosamine N-acyltransferase